MKKLNLYCLFALLCSIIIYSCQKIGPWTEFNPNKPVKGCLITELASGAYDLPLTYNSKNNPATISGFPISYDDQNRLVKIQYSPTFYTEWKYNDNTSLPALSNTYFNGSIGSKDIFTYDKSGRLIKLDLVFSNQNATGEVIWLLNYNAKGNITTITQPGTTAPIFEGTSYDEKPNFAGANQWVKYILIQPETGYPLYSYLLFSRNNATKWSLNDASVGLIFSDTKSFYQYNDKNFAIKDSTIFNDPVNGGFTDVQTNTFNCL